MSHRVAALTPPTLLALGFLLPGWGAPRAGLSSAVPDSPRRTIQPGFFLMDPTSVRDPLNVGPESSPGRECLAHRRAGSSARPGEARFAMDRDDGRFRVRSAALTRRLMCGFRGGRLVSATERFSLQLVSQDRENPGFTTGAPNMSRRFYLVCEGSLATSLPAFVAGQQLSFADNTFTLPCGHMIYPAGVAEPTLAERVSGAYAYKVRSAALRVSSGPTVERPTFDVSLDVVVVNPIETLRLRGRMVGRLAMTAAVVDCPTEPRYTKQDARPECP